MGGFEARPSAAAPQTVCGPPATTLRAGHRGSYAIDSKTALIEFGQAAGGACEAMRTPEAAPTTSRALWWPPEGGGGGAVKLLTRSRAGVADASPLSPPVSSDDTGSRDGTAATESATLPPLQQRQPSPPPLPPRRLSLSVPAAALPSQLLAGLRGSAAGWGDSGASGAVFDEESAAAYAEGYYACHASMCHTVFATRLPPELVSSSNPAPAGAGLGEAITRAAPGAEVAHHFLDGASASAANQTGRLASGFIDTYPG